jgi:hypothetical protein
VTTTRGRSPDAPPGAPPPARRGRRRRAWLVGVVVLFLLVVCAFAGLQAARAGLDARHARASLFAAEATLTAQDLAATRTNLTAADQSLRAMKRKLDGMGPILPVAKVIPVVRSQVIAVETFQSAGILLTQAGLRLTDATQKVLDESTGDTPVSGAVDKLRSIQGPLSSGADSLRVAERKVAKLKGRWLIGPIATARNDLNRRLPSYERRATSASDGLNALIAFAGGNGPRRYLFLSQNPDEIRPTGGYIGTYGLISATTGKLDLERFEDSHNFLDAHPNAVVPPAQAGSPFRFAQPPLPQSLTNVNNLPDFAGAAKMAAQLWNGSGEPHVDGVLSVTPSFLARILAVVGPVNVPDFGETVDSGNVIARFDFYTEQLNADPSSTTESVRKGFVSSLAEQVMKKVLAAPSSQWQALAKAVGQAFDAREAMAWSSDQQVASALQSRHWDNTLPAASGDFFYNAEFSYAAKIDRSLRRQFDQHVELRADGSARITTTMVVNNPKPGGFTNPGSLSYVTVYGPNGAVLDKSSDPPQSLEPALAGHPAAGWFVGAPPGGKAKLTVVWNVPNLLQKGPNGTREFSLWWLHLPDHAGDVLNLRVDPPPGWRWKGSAPPSQASLDQDVKGTWVLTK